MNNLIFNVPIKTFIEDIEIISKSSNTGYIDAIIHWCYKNNTEVELVVPIILKNKTLKRKLQFEAEDLNFLPKRKKLPI